MILLQHLDRLINQGFDTLIVEADVGAPRTNHFYESIGLKHISTMKQDISAYAPGEFMLYNYYSSHNLPGLRKTLQEMIEQDKTILKRKAHNNEQRFTEPAIIS